MTRIARLSVVIALTTLSAFAPTPTAAGPPSSEWRGFLSCAGTSKGEIQIHFGTDFRVRTVREAVQSCFRVNGHPVGVHINR